MGKPTLNDFKFASSAIPVPPAGHILLKTLYVSVDPYLRGRMNDSKSYVPSFKIGKPIQSGIIAEVIDSTHAELKTGDFVSGILEWKDLQKTRLHFFWQKQLVEILRNALETEK